LLHNNDPGHVGCLPPRKNEPHVLQSHWNVKTPEETLTSSVPDFSTSEEYFKLLPSIYFYKWFSSWIISHQSGHRTRKV
jgi:hypothetical protein